MSRVLILPSPACRLLALVAAAIAAALLPLAADVRTAARAGASGPAGGYWLVASDGGIFSFGDARFFGSTGDVRLNRPIVGMAPTSSGSGYWLVASDGGIFTFGDARFFGSTGDVRLNRPIVGMAPTSSGSGYWLVASDGGVFSFGDARFFGSTGDIALNQPITAMVPTPSGAGYWLVASDGGVFSFGDAGFHGSAAGLGTARTIVAMAATPTGKGYWQASAAGEVLAFGDAAALGSTGPLNVPIVGMSATPTGAGYWLVARDGGIFSFGDAGFFGSTGAIRLNQPIVGLGHGAAVAPAGGGSPAPGSGTGNTGGTGPVPGATTTTTAPPATGPGPASAGPHPADPDGSPPEAIPVPMKSPYGGPSHLDIPATPNDCGFPAMPQRTDLPDDTDYIGEASGMIASRRHPGVHWVVRDSGHTAAVNAVRIDADGMAVSREILVDGALNGDWEEINYTIGPDGQARLWVVDNGGKIGNRKIYEILEPDPDTATSVAVENEYPWKYPDGSYNTEASFMVRGYLIVVTKTTPHARMYRFDTLRPGVTNEPTYLGQLGNSKDVSVVRQSPDGKYLVTASHELVHLYRSTDGSGSLQSFGGRLPDCEMRAFPDDHVEAGEFSANREMLFLDEVKKVFRLPLAP